MGISGCQRRGGPERASRLVEDSGSRARVNGRWDIVRLERFHYANGLSGTRVQSLKEGEITMDIDLRWGGDPNIVLAVQAAHVASIPFQLKDLQVFTIVRAIFQLSDEIPCISAVVVALLAEPKRQIDYTLKAVGGSLTAIPGLSDMIDRYVAVAPPDRRTHWWRTCRYKVLGGFNQTIFYSLSPGSGATPAMARPLVVLPSCTELQGTIGINGLMYSPISMDFTSANMIGGKGLRGKSWPDWSYKENEPRVLQGGYRVTIAYLAGPPKFVAGAQ
ncbi:hypothetical protein CASFOL_037735 [Castilleja foliolosa]|uniref:Uncharacterized protein n=1 Tax=Castilleja foliolosa TaxID=1961234 RepID=A0ABD3BJH2_9LAMI